MAFDPRYASNRRFYVDYTNANGDTRVVALPGVARRIPTAPRPPRARVLLRVDQPYDNHNGGQLQFGPDGRLYVGMGDGGSGGDPQGRAQDPRSRLGKLLRINVDVSPVRVSIYAKGLRNPWRFSFDRATGALWIGDVGQNAWEEIDYLRPGRPAGANLGWNGYEGTHVYNAAVAARLNRSRADVAGRAVRPRPRLLGDRRLRVPRRRRSRRCAASTCSPTSAPGTCGPRGPRRQRGSRLPGADGQADADLVVRRGRARRAVRRVARRLGLQDRPALTRDEPRGDADGGRGPLQAGEPQAQRRRPSRNQLVWWCGVPARPRLVVAALVQVEDLEGGEVARELLRRAEVQVHLVDPAALLARDRLADGVVLGSRGDSVLRKRRPPGRATAASAAANSRRPIGPSRW